MPARIAAPPRRVRPTAVACVRVAPFRTLVVDASDRFRESNILFVHLHGFVEFPEVPEQYAVVPREAKCELGVAEFLSCFIRLV